MKKTETRGYPQNLYAAVFGIIKDEEIECLIPYDVNETLNSVLSVLPAIEQFVLIKRYKEKKTLQEIAEMNGKTRNEVRLVEAKALRKLRHPMYARRLKFGDSQYENCLTELQIAINQSVADATRYADAVLIEELGFSTRLYNCLKRGGIDSLGDILLAPPEELATIRNFGRKAALELIEKLDKNGVNYAMIKRGEFDEKAASFFGIEEEEWK